MHGPIYVKFIQLIWTYTLQNIEVYIIYNKIGENMGKFVGCTPRVRWFTQKKYVQLEVIFCQVLSLAGQGEVKFLEENTFPLKLFSITDLTWIGQESLHIEHIILSEKLTYKLNGLLQNIIR